MGAVRSPYLELNLKCSRKFVETLLKNASPLRNPQPPIPYVHIPVVPNAKVGVCNTRSA